MKIYKLYNNTGYRCRVNIQELKFLFGIQENDTPEQINQVLKTQGYYIK